MLMIITVPSFVILATLPPPMYWFKDFESSLYHQIESNTITLIEREVRFPNVTHWIRQ